MTNSKGTNDGHGPEQHKAVFQRFVEAINNRDLDALDDLLQPDFARHCQATAPIDIRSLDEFRAFLQEDQATFPDQHLETVITIADGDKIGVYMTLTGTQEGPIGAYPATGKSVTVPFLSILRFQEGKIAEMWVEWDNLNVLAQLGHVVRKGPSPS